MRCNNIIMAGIKNAWSYLLTPRSCSSTSNKFFSIISIVLPIVLTISFYYRNIRRVKPTTTTKNCLRFSSDLSRFPYEPTIFLIWATFIWFSKTGLYVLNAFFNQDTRSKMWEGMDILGGNGRETLIFIGYFVFLEVIEITVSEKYMMKKYQDYKNKAMLPLTEEKEALLESFEEKKEISIYEAIASTPPPSESESAALLTDSESNTLITPRPSLWQRIKNYIKARQYEVTAGSVLGRYYMMAFMKCNLLLCFGVLANTAVCKLTPEQYFDNKAEEFMLLLVACLIWTVRGFWTLGSGIRFARAELMEQKSVAV